MSLELYLAFLAACVLLALAPGPAMSLIIATTVSRGLFAGLRVVAGNGTGLVVLVVAATLGTGTLLVVMADWLDVVRLVGAAYLIWLGAVKLRRAWGPRNHVISPEGQQKLYLQGLLVGLSNPKVLLFLGAFFPQFVEPSGNIAWQMTLLAVGFIIAVVGTDVLLAVLVAHVRRGWNNRIQRTIDSWIGLLLIGGGVWLSLNRR